MIPSSLRKGCILLLALALSACGAQEGSAPGKAGLAMEACEELGSRARCGQLSVLENPQAGAEADARHIKLNIVRLPAVASSPKADPVFVLVGGPGEAATELADRLPPLFRELNRERDLVLVDQRGTGQSNPLDCASAEPFDYALGSRESAQRQMALLRRCLAGYQADLRFYTTPYAVDDLEAVRQALGYDDINLWGGSYGSRVALIYLRRHPQLIRAAVLDGVAPLAIQLPHHALADADAALRKLIDHCEKAPSCHQRFADLEARSRTLIADLNREPRQIQVEHPLTQERLSVYMDGDLLASLIRMALYQRDLGPLLPLAIELAGEGDFRPFIWLLTSLEDLSDNISLGLQQTILCAEDVLRPVSAGSSENSILQLDMSAAARAICEFWPRGQLPEGYFEAVKSEAPVLLISGALDPVTPLRWGELAAQSLSNSRHIVVPGAHHIASHSGCMVDLVVDFIDSADPESLETACVADIKPLSPFISMAGPAMQPETAPEGEEAARD